MENLELLESLKAKLLNMLEEVEIEQTRLVEQARTISNYYCAFSQPERQPLFQFAEE